MKYIQIPKPDKQNKLLTETIRQIKAETLLVPPIHIQSLIPQVFASSWNLFRELYLVDGLVSRERKEAVNVAISIKNACPYCINVHSILLQGLKSQNLAKAIQNNDLNAIADTKTRDIVEWALDAYRFGSERRQTSPFDTEEAVEIIGTAHQFHYTNRLVNVFLEGEFLPTYGRNISGWVMSKAMRMKGMIGSKLLSGKSAGLLAEYPLLKEFEWALPNPVIHKALLNQYWVLQNAVNQIVSDEVKNLLQTELENWDGGDRGISKSWVNEALSTLNQFDKSVARIAILTAFASYQLDENDVKEFKKNFPLDQDLFAVVAWSANFAATYIVNKS